MTKRATLSDVARAAGVSKMTASRALRGVPDVSKSSMQKVRQVAEEIGYVANPLATSLSSQRSNLVGVMVPSLRNAVFSEVLSGIAEEISDTPLQPVFGVTEYDTDQELETLRNMLSWRPSGLIVTGLDQPPAIRQMLETAGVPVVQIMDLDGTPVDRCVGLSHREAGAAMAEALLKEGRRNFAYVAGGMLGDTRAQKRLAGFAQTLAQNGSNLLAIRRAAASSQVDAGRRLTAELLTEIPKIDCIYYSNDDVASGGLYHCLAEGIAVPDTVLLAGFNGLDFIDSLPAPIATTRTPRHEIGRLAARMVLDGDARNGEIVAMPSEITLVQNPA